MIHLRDGDREPIHTDVVAQLKVCKACPYVMKSDEGVKGRFTYCCTFLNGNGNNKPFISKRWIYKGRVYYSSFYTRVPVRCPMVDEHRKIAWSLSENG